MNLLFVNYGDFSTNSLNHIGGFANRLCSLGHACIVAVPHGRESVRFVADPLFIPALHADILAGKAAFPDGRPADLIHAWTPRQCVRAFVSAYQRGLSGPARLVIHLEENEEYLISAYARLPLEAVEALDARDLDRLLPPGLSHPQAHRVFLSLADAVTVVTARLREKAPAEVPVHLLEPGLAPGQGAGASPPETLRRELGLCPDERVLVFTGADTFANEAEVRDLYVAVALLNAGDGPRVRLVRTGSTGPGFQAGLPVELRGLVLDLGQVERTRLPGLRALADVLVQPGRPGPFTDYRLPAKLPEFLASGRPVVLPAGTIGGALTDGVEAILLKEGSPEEIAAACRRIFADPQEALRMGARAAAFARRRFDLDANTSALLAFYGQVLQEPAHPTGAGAAWARIAGTEATDLSAAAAGLAARLAAGQTALAPLARDLARLICLEEQRSAATRRAQEAGAADAACLGARLASLRTALRSARVLRLLSGRHIRNLQTRQATTERAAREELAKAWGEHRAVASRVVELHGELQARDAKVRAMLASLSWRLTAPLRDLERLAARWTGRGRPPAPGASAGPGPGPGGHCPAAPPSGLPDRNGAGAQAAAGCETGSDRHTVVIDRPRSWSTTAPLLPILGWCLENGGRPVLGVRASLGGAAVEADYGLARPDVAALKPDDPQAGHCGFRLALPVAGGDHTLLIEAREQEGWIPVLRAPFHGGSPGDDQDCNAHEAWIARNDRLGDEDLGAIRQHIARMTGAPRISVLMPVFNPPVEFLERAVASVTGQLYADWELCIADDASTDPRIRALLERLAAADGRIRVVFRPENGHICAASNAALELASGGYVALLDHDDLLAPTALYEVAAALNARPALRFIYSDEDKVGPDERRFDPYFKPDWNPDLLLGQAYTCHLSVFETALVRRLGGFRKGYEGSQDWDLTLRVTDSLPASAIHHIPRILYHWRAIAGSTASRLDQKDYAAEAGRRALADHLARLGEAGEVLPVPGGHWRIRRPLPPIPPMVSIIIPTRNGTDLLRRAVSSLLGRTDYPDFEILIVDNRSDDPDALAYLAALARAEPGRVRVIAHGEPFNYAAINNRAAGLARGQVLALLNNDVEAITPGWLSEMVSQALRPGVGAVGALLYYPHGTVQHAGVILGLGGVAGHAFKDFPRGDAGYKNRLRLVQNYSAVTAACMVVRKDRFLEVGGLDERNLAVAFNDVDLCCKLVAAGYRTVWTPFAEFYHHESASRGPEDTPGKKARFEAENAHMLAAWSAVLESDPAYNPNLSLVSEDFSPALATRAQPPWR